jgi:sugar O-acyltransferase (sialic acid O-acetyltransferase NeuD family)
MTAMSIVLFGATSSMIVEVEETCARLGLAIAAIVKNVDGPDHALAPERIVMADAVGAELKSLPFLIPIFTPGHRWAAFQDADRRGFRHPTTIVDPTAVVATSTTLGAGTYVNSRAVIGAASRIGSFVFVNRAANIGHHVEIADFVSVGPGATVAGAVRLDRGAVVAAGAVVLPGIEIGNNTVVAAGAVVQQSVPDHCLVAGNPARVVRTGYAGYQGFSV